MHSPTTNRQGDCGQLPLPEQRYPDTCTDDTYETTTRLNLRSRISYHHPLPRRNNNIASHSFLSSPTFVRFVFTANLSAFLTFCSRIR